MSDKVTVPIIVILLGVIIVLVSTGIAKGEEAGARAKQLAATISELEARDVAISDRVSDIVADTQRQLDEAIRATALSGDVTTGITSALQQSEDLGARLRRADALTGVLVTAIAGLIETEQLTRVVE